jgi:hypothetical protein
MIGRYERKKVNCISGCQLREKTGCSERAINLAIENLVWKKLIEVRDDRERSGFSTTWLLLSLTLWT